MKVDSKIVVEASPVITEVPVFLVTIDRLFSGTKPSVLVLSVDADSVLPGADSEGRSVEAWVTSEDPPASVDWVVPGARAEDSTLGTIVGIVSTFVRLSVVPDARAEESALGTTVGIVSISVRLSVVPMLVKISVVPEIIAEELPLGTSVGMVSTFVTLSVVPTLVKSSVVPEVTTEELALGITLGMVSTFVKLSVV